MNKVDIEVQTQYIAEQSDPDNAQFVYSYTINITNNGSSPAQLISRHWIITDANDGVQEVQGLGVIGKQPTIKPGESYCYTSGVVMETNTGIMTGSYTMQTESGDEFLTDIPHFALIQPGAMH